MKIENRRLSNPAPWSNSGRGSAASNRLCFASLKGTISHSGERKAIRKHTTLLSLWVRRRTDQLKMYNDERRAPRLLDNSLRPGRVASLCNAAVLTQASRDQRCTSPNPSRRRQSRLRINHQSALGGGGLADSIETKRTWRARRVGR